MLSVLVCADSIYKLVLHNVVCLKMSCTTISGLPLLLGVARASTAPPRYTALAAPAAKSLSVGLNQEEIATKNSKNIPSKLNSQELPKLINTFQKIESK